jgi:hypothetical protein
MGKDPWRIRASAISCTGALEAKAKTKQSWQGRNRRRIEEAVGGEEDGDSETESSRQKEGRDHKDGSEEGSGEGGEECSARQEGGNEEANGEEDHPGCSTGSTASFVALLCPAALPMDFGYAFVGPFPFGVRAVRITQSTSSLGSRCMLEIKHFAFPDHAPVNGVFGNSALCLSIGIKSSTNRAHVRWCLSLGVKISPLGPHVQNDVPNGMPGASFGWHRTEHTVPETLFSLPARDGLD